MWMCLRMFVQNQEMKKNFTYLTDGREINRNNTRLNVTVCEENP